MKGIWWVGGATKIEHAEDQPGSENVTTCFFGRGGDQLQNEVKFRKWVMRMAGDLPRTYPRVVIEELLQHRGGVPSEVIQKALQICLDLPNIDRSKYVQKIEDYLGLQRLTQNKDTQAIITDLFRRLPFLIDQKYQRIKEISKEVGLEDELGQFTDLFLNYSIEFTAFEERAIDSKSIYQFVLGLQEIQERIFEEPLFNEILRKALISIYFEFSLLSYNMNLAVLEGTVYFGFTKIYSSLVAGSSESAHFMNLLLGFIHTIASPKIMSLKGKGLEPKEEVESLNNLLLLIMIREISPLLLRGVEVTIEEISKTQIGILIQLLKDAHMINTSTSAVFWEYLKRYIEYPEERDDLDFDFIKRYTLYCRSQYFSAKMEPFAIAIPCLFIKYHVLLEHPEKDLSMFIEDIYSLLPNCYFARESEVEEKLPLFNKFFYDLFSEILSDAFISVTEKRPFDEKELSMYEKINSTDSNQFLEVFQSKLIPSLSYLSLSDFFCYTSRHKRDEEHQDPKQTKIYQYLLEVHPGGQKEVESLVEHFPWILHPKLAIRALPILLANFLCIGASSSRSSQDLADTLFSMFVNYPGNGAELLFEVNEDNFRFTLYKRSIEISQDPGISKKEINDRIATYGEISSMMNTTPELLGFACASADFTKIVYLSDMLHYFLLSYKDCTRKSDIHKYRNNIYWANTIYFDQMENFKYSSMLKYSENNKKINDAFSPCPFLILIDQLTPIEEILISENHPTSENELRAKYPTQLAVDLIEDMPYQRIIKIELELELLMYLQLRKYEYRDFERYPDEELHRSNLLNILYTFYMSDNKISARFRYWQKLNYLVEIAKDKSALLEQYEIIAEFFSGFRSRRRKVTGLCFLRYALIGSNQLFKIDEILAKITECDKSSFLHLCLRRKYLGTDLMSLFIDRTTYRDKIPNTLINLITYFHEYDHEARDILYGNILPLMKIPGNNNIYNRELFYNLDKYRQFRVMRNAIEKNGKIDACFPNFEVLPEINENSFVSLLALADAKYHCTIGQEQGVVYLYYALEYKIIIIDPLTIEKICEILQNEWKYVVSNSFTSIFYISLLVTHLYLTCSSILLTVDRFLSLSKILLGDCEPCSVTLTSAQKDTLLAKLINVVKKIPSWKFVFNFNAIMQIYLEYQSCTQLTKLVFEILKRILDKFPYQSVWWLGSPEVSKSKLFKKNKTHPLLSSLIAQVNGKKLQRYNKINSAFVYLNSTFQISDELFKLKRGSRSEVRDLAYKLLKNVDFTDYEILFPSREQIYPVLPRKNLYVGESYIPFTSSILYFMTTPEIKSASSITVFSSKEAPFLFECRVVSPQSAEPLPARPLLIKRYSCPPDYSELYFPGYISALFDVISLEPSTIESPMLYPYSTSFCGDILVVEAIQNLVPLHEKLKSKATKSRSKSHDTDRRALLANIADKQLPEKTRSDLEWFMEGMVTWNLIGFLNGIGDRHLSNILVDSNLLRVHFVDFELVFGCGRFLPVSERIEMRLTPSIELAYGYFGLTGYYSEGFHRIGRVLQEKEEEVRLLVKEFCDRMEKDKRSDKLRVASNYIQKLEKYFSKSFIQDEPALYEVIKFNSSKEVNAKMFEGWKPNI